MAKVLEFQLQHHSFQRNPRADLLQNGLVGLGWTTFTDRVISILNEREDPVIFLLWGANAKEKLELITNPKHFVLSAHHPSPLSASRGFFGCRHYSKVNTILKRIGKEPVDWRL